VIPILKNRISIISLVISIFYFVLPVVFMNKIFDWPLLTSLTTLAWFPYLTSIMIIGNLFIGCLFQGILVLLGWGILYFIIKTLVLGFTKNEHDIK
jgi:hypothetical protein